MSNRFNRKPISGGVQTFGGFIGAVSGVAGFFLLLASLGLDSSQTKSLIMYGSIAAIALGMMLMHYAEKSSSNSPRHTEKEKVGYSSTKDETNETVSSSRRIPKEEKVDGLPKTTAQQLEQLKELYSKKLLSKKVYEEKQREIINKL
jgi:hypothetical protein